MDESTERMAARFPEEVITWLKLEAEARGWNLSRTLRWAVKETMQRENQRKLEKQMSGDDRHRQVQAKEAFSL